MDIDDVIQPLANLVAEMKTYGVPYRMKKQAYSDVLASLESVLIKVRENKGEDNEE